MSSSGHEHVAGPLSTSVELDAWSAPGIRTVRVKHQHMWAAQMLLSSPLNMQPGVCPYAGELSTDAGGSSGTEQGPSRTVPDMMLHPLPPLGGATAAVPRAAPVTWIDLRRKANIVRCVSQLVHANTEGWVHAQMSITDNVDAR